MDKLIRVLYKKIHRQYLKEWRKGRKFKYRCSYAMNVYEITKEPHICERYIQVEEVDRYNEKVYDVIITLDSGKIIADVTWLRN